MTPRTVFWTLAVLAVAAGHEAAAQQLPDKWFVVEQSAVNTQSSFMLRVDVDRPDRIYSVGETMTVTVKPERDCYLYLIYYGANNQVACLFPNKYQQNNHVRAGNVVTIPSPDAGFQFTARPPCGKEILQVVGTLKPVDILKAQQKELTKDLVTMLKTDDLKDMVIELKKGKMRDWAEARIEITTVPSVTQDKPRTQGRRYAVCVGISQYKCERVPPLQVSHKDAEHMAARLKESCRVDEVMLLTNSQATREGIETAIFKDLPRKTQAGDEVLIFFSCHGGRCADTSGDEQDGTDEYIVPHDGEVGKPETMILDDTFARWMQELDGRKIGIILDNCYSGGSSKGLSAKGLGGTAPRADALSIFYGNELGRAKALGQKGTIVLAACQENQLAWEMPGKDDGSVLTCYVLRAVADPQTDDNRDGHISIGEIYRHIKEPIEQYVRKTFSADQNPVLLDNADDQVWLKP